MDNHDHHHHEHSDHAHRTLENSMIRLAIALIVVLAAIFLSRPFILKQMQERVEMYVKQGMMDDADRVIRKMAWLNRD